MDLRHSLRSVARRFLGLSALVAASLIAGLAAAQRPAAADLFPFDTLAFVRLADAADFKQRMRDSSWGRMSNDPQLRPLVEAMYGSLGKAFGAVEADVGLSLDQLLSIPQGEVAVGVVPVGEGQPALLVLVDAGESLPLVETLIDRGRKLLDQRGAASREERVAGSTITIYEWSEGGPRTVAYALRDKSLVASSNATALAELLKQWNGEGSAPLSASPDFAAIAARCRGAEGEPAQILGYVNPIDLVRNVTGDNTAARVGLAMLPALGLDGLVAVGGSVNLCSGQFDMLIHLHALVDNPRTGVLDLVVLESGDMTPQRWVPADVASYSTFYWNINETYTRAEKLFDSFNGQGGFGRLVESRFTAPTGVDLKKDLLPLLSGRFTMLSMIERPVMPDSQGTIIAAEVSDGDAALKLVERTARQLGFPVEKQTFAGVSYLAIQTPFVQPQSDPAAPPRRTCVAAIGSSLVIADRAAFIESVVRASSDSSSGLAASLQYKLVSSKVEREVRGEPSLVSYEQPEEGMRFMYELASSPAMRERMQSGAASFPLLGDLNQALQDHPLPPFSVIAQYLAPGGAVLTDDESGWHYMSFGLRREGGD